jgi:hypothetical protein
LNDDDGAKLADRLEAGLATGPGVANLRRGRAARLMHGVRQQPQPGHGLFPHVDLLGVGASLGRHGQVSYRRHSHAARRDSPMEVDELIGDETLGRHSFERGRLDDAVAKRQRPELAGAKDRRRHVTRLGLHQVKLASHWASAPSLTPKPTGRPPYPR